MDKEIKPIVDALNAAGIKTIASCDGHGFQPGSVIIDYNGVDKEIRLYTYEQARKIDKLFPKITGEPSNPHAEVLKELEDWIAKKGLFEVNTKYMGMREIMDTIAVLKTKHGIKEGKG